LIYYLILCLLIVACIFLGYYAFKRKETNKHIEEYNQQLEKHNEVLIQEKTKLSQDIYSLREMNKTLTEAEQQLFKDIGKQNEILDNLKKHNEQIASDAFSNYMQILEESYASVEDDYDARVARLKKDLTTVQDELNVLKETRAAAHKALLKEQEVKDNKDNYRLLPSQADLTDARRLEIVKRELNKPRILSMLIWQTYWQPLAKKQFPIILQDKTKMGIYKITNTITDDCYIGQAVDVYKRWCEHCKCGLGIDTPPGNKLYKAIQEYGLENFTFELLTECSASELNEKEKYFIELYQSNTFGYNSTGGNR